MGWIADNSTMSKASETTYANWRADIESCLMERTGLSSADLYAGAMGHDVFLDGITAEDVADIMLDED